MPASVRTGLFLPHPGGVGAALEYAAWAEQAGFDGLWCADRGDVDVLTLAAAIAARTKTIRLGMAVVPVYTRTPAVLAATAATLANLAPGRFVLGLGASSGAMIEGWHGLDWHKPLTRVRETVTLLRTMLSGERTDFTGATLRSHGYRLGAPPSAGVPIVLAGMRPKSLELAGELGDGVAFNMAPLQAIPRMLGHVAEGAARAGRTDGPLEVIANLKVRLTDGSAAAAQAAREDFRTRWWGYYTTPVYNQFLAWSGFAAEAAAIREASQRKDRTGVMAALTDAVVDSLLLTGDAPTCRARVAEFAAAGVTTPIVLPVTEDGDAFRATCALFAPGGHNAPQAPGAPA